MGRLDEVAVKKTKRKSTAKKSRDPRKRKAEEDHESSDSGEDAQPSLESEQRSVKTVKKPKLVPTDDEDSGRESDDARPKLQKNNEGERFVDLGKKRRVTVRDFKGSTLVDIREFYGSDGDEKPGKKGHCTVC